MNGFSEPLKAYITKEESESQKALALEERDSEWIEKYNKLSEDNARFLSEIEQRYHRTTVFVKAIFDRLVKQRHIEDKIFPPHKSAIGRTTYALGAFVEIDEIPNDLKSLGPSGSGKPSVSALREVDKLLTLGFDFERLLNAIKQDELLAGQWKKIMMTMKLSDSKFADE